MAYAAQYPKNIRALVLSASGGIDVTWKEYVLQNILSRLSITERQHYDFWNSPEQKAKDPVKADLEATRALVPAYIYHKEFVPEIEAALTNPNFSTPGVNELVWKSMETYDLKDAFKNFSAPVLIVDGRQDFLGELVPTRIHEAIPSSRLEFLNECAHYPWLDAPKEYFSLILDFLKPRNR
jgi:proline iminopeptidase